KKLHFFTEPILIPRLNRHCKLPGRSSTNLRLVRGVLECAGQLEDWVPLVPLPRRKLVEKVLGIRLVNLHEQAGGKHTNGRWNLDARPEADKKLGVITYLRMFF